MYSLNVNIILIPQEPKI